VGVVFVAVGCGALINANRLWANSMLAVVLVMLFVGLISWAVLRGQRQAFWSGFAIVGWGYFLLIQTSPSLVDHNRLLTTTVLRNLHVMVAVEEKRPLEGTPTFPMPPGTRGEYTFTALIDGPSPDEQSFSQVGHALWTLILALLGGLLARYFYSTRADES